MKTAATIVASVAATLLAVCVYDSYQDPPAPQAVSTASDDVAQRLDRLENAVMLLVQSRANAPAPAPVVMAAPAASAQPEDPKEVERRAVQRQQAIQKSASVIDQMVNTGRMTQDDGIALSVATANLDGPERAKIYGKLAVAINEGRVKPDQGAL